MRRLGRDGAGCKRGVEFYGGWCDLISYWGCVEV